MGVVMYLIQIAIFVGIVASDVYWRWAPSVALSFVVAAIAAFLVSAAYQYGWKASPPTTPQERRSRYAAVISWIGGYARTCTGLVAFFAAYELASRFFGITNVQDVSNGMLALTLIVLALATFGINALSRAIAEKVDPGLKAERLSKERANDPPDLRTRR